MHATSGQVFEAVVSDLLVPCTVVVFNIDFLDDGGAFSRGVDAYTAVLVVYPEMLIKVERKREMEPKTLSG